MTALGLIVVCGLIAIAGKRGSAPTMVLSRAAFGVQGQKVPGIISWLTSIGWETFLAILAVLATATVITQLGGDGESIALRSAPGRGTTVIVRMPVHFRRVEGVTG